LASIRGEKDIAVGNVVGSNIFNVLGVLGVAAVIGQNGVSLSPAVLRFDIPVMIAVALSCLPIFLTGHKIVRWEGLVFLFYFVGYTLYLILDAKNHSMIAPFNGVMMSIVFPLTVITFLVVLVRHYQNGALPLAKDLK
jgi:cation:H+ antiporter